jgi:hypothetical protein
LCKRYSHGSSVGAKVNEKPDGSRVYKGCLVGLNRRNPIRIGEAERPGALALPTHKYSKVQMDIFPGAGSKENDVLLQ